MTFPEFSIHPLVIPAAVGIYGILHSLTASLNIKERVSRISVAGFDRYYRLLYSLFSSVTLLPVIALPLLIPDLPLYTIPRPYLFITVLIQITAVGLLAYSLFQTGALQFIGIPQAMGMKNNDKLNTKGLYHYLRHPLYTFSLLFIWLTPVMTRNYLLLYAAFTVYVLIGAVLEERRLLKTFGEAYSRYQAKTPFMIPFLGK
jgi:protein-S-isoprenylcysteine O-methyltransferase Ste14